MRACKILMLYRILKAIQKQPLVQTKIMSRSNQPYKTTIRNLKKLRKLGLIETAITLNGKDNHVEGIGITKRGKQIINEIENLAINQLHFTLKDLLKP